MTIFAGTANLDNLMEEKVKILAFGAHPDDVELSCSGTLIKHVAMGDKVAIVDLTYGELGTRGSKESRMQESDRAAGIMQVSFRECLAFKDGFFKNDEEHQKKIIEVIRKYRPDIVLCNAFHDRHPDHGRGSSLVSDSCFLSGLSKITTFDANQTIQPAWRPSAVYHYIQDRYLAPSFLVDISGFMEKKMEAIKAYKTQFYDVDSKEPATYISNPKFLDNITSRAAEFGRIIGVDYAEGFTSERLFGVQNLNVLI